jgi:hypothetical protein
MCGGVMQFKQRHVAAMAGSPVPNASDGIAFSGFIDCRLLAKILFAENRLPSMIACRPMR